MVTDFPLRPLYKNPLEFHGRIFSYLELERGYCQLNSPKLDNPAMNTYKRHRFPPDIISYAVWLYYRFNLSHRDIEDLLAERGITVSREAIRLWSIKFGARYT
jgi:hypothetical protein